MIRQIDIPKVKKHSFFVYPISPWLFIYLTILCFCLSQFSSAFFCQYQHSSSLCLSLSRHPFVYLTYPQQPFGYLCLVTLLSISPTLSPLSVSVSSPFCLSRLPSAAFCLISLSAGFCLSILNSALCISVLLGPFLYLPFPKPSIRKEIMV
jgi:hypothetical protein